MLVAVILLRLPSFHPAYFGTDESFYVVSAQKILDGGHQYADTWDNKPPMIGWFYTLFVWLFGKSALFAVRIFTCIYLFGAAVFLNQLVIANKLLREFSLLSGFLFLLLCSVPWYAQELNSEILMTLPVMAAFYQLYNLTERESQNWSYLFVAGLLLGIALMIKYQAIFLFLGFLLAYLIVFPPKVSELASIFGGFFLSVGIVLIAVYFSGAFNEFWKIGVLYNLDYLSLGKNPGEITDPLGNLIQYFKLWGVYLVASIIGAGLFLVNYFTYSIQIRKIETVLIIWFFAGFLTILIGAGRLYLHYFILIVPPVAIYAAKFFDMKARKWVLGMVSLAGLGFPIFTYGVFLVSAFPQTFSFADKWIETEGWTDSFRRELNNKHILSYHIDPKQAQNGILILDFEPELYLKLDAPCATHYTNFSIAYYRLPVFQGAESTGLFSGFETESDIYRQFTRQKPAYIIDKLSLSLFPRLKENFPLVFKDYAEKTVGKYKLYYLN